MAADGKTIKVQEVKEVSVDPKPLNTEAVKITPTDGKAEYVIDKDTEEYIIRNLLPAINAKAPRKYSISTFKTIKYRTEN